VTHCTHSGPHEAFPTVLWQTAARIDSSLESFGTYTRSLTRKELLPTSFSWDRLFAAMVGGDAVLFTEFPVAVLPSPGKSPSETLVDDVIRRADEWPRLLPVWTGRAQKRGHLGVRELLRRWTTSTEIVGITDLAVRGTSVKRRIATAAIDRQNILVSRNERIFEQEMLTLVISSAGHFSDSHSDDPDGWNYSVSGSKLWLIWETFEGLAHGLEDVERTDTCAKAGFDIATFATLRSARWLVVHQGQGLFLPGSYTHKVITLERYLGFGSFIVFLPGYLQTLLRWKKHGALWELQDPKNSCAGLVDEISRAVTARIRLLARRALVERRESGLPELQKAVARWHQRSSPAERTMLRRDSASAKFLDVVLAEL
jgi:hypothetical protein